MMMKSAATLYVLLEAVSRAAATIFISFHAYHFMLRQAA